MVFLPAEGFLKAIGSKNTGNFSDIIWQYNFLYVITIFIELKNFLFPILGRLLVF